MRNLLLITAGEIHSEKGNGCKILVNENVKITYSKGKEVAAGKGVLSFGTKKGTEYLIIRN
ncbi:MAG: hypothetical protein ACOYM7_02395 [Paludibacter sp.]